MGFCPICKAEYRPGFDRCSDCQIDLVDELPVEENHVPNLNIKLVKIATFSSMPEADLALSYLENEGIECNIVRDTASGWRSELAFIRGIDIVVSEENASRATEIINSIGK